MWLPDGQTARRTLYDAATVMKLAKKLPLRRAAAPITTRRLRRLARCRQSKRHVDRSGAPRMGGYRSRSSPQSSVASRGR